MEFSRKEYWSGLLFLSPADLPDVGMKPRSFAFQVDALPSEPPGKLMLVIDIYSLFFRFFSHIGHYRVLSKGSLGYRVGSY